MEITNALRVLEVFRNFAKEHGHLEIPITAMHLFLAIANNPKASSRDLRTIAGQDAVTISRITQVLSQGRKRGANFQKGLEIVSLSPDAMDYRSNVFTITPKGQKLLEEIKKI